MERRLKALQVLNLFSLASSPSSPVHAHALPHLRAHHQRRGVGFLPARMQIRQRGDSLKRGRRTQAKEWSDKDTGTVHKSRLERKKEAAAAARSALLSAISPNMQAPGKEQRTSCASDWQSEVKHTAVQEGVAVLSRQGSCSQAGAGHLCKGCHNPRQRPWRGVLHMHSSYFSVQSPMRHT